MTIKKNILILLTKTDVYAYHANQLLTTLVEYYANISRNHEHLNV